MLSYNLVIAVVRFPGDEEHLPQMQSIEPCVVDIRFIDHEDAVRGKGQISLLGHFYVVLTAICDDNERRDGALQIKQGVDLERSLALAVLGPGEDVEAKMDQGRVEHFEWVAKFKAMLGSQGYAAGKQMIIQTLEKPIITTRIDIA